MKRWLAAALLVMAWAGAANAGHFPGRPLATLNGAEEIPCAETDATPCYTTPDALKSFIGATVEGGVVANDITQAPYNATCDGVADDSAAFELAVDTGGVFFVPPLSTCILKTTASHVWNTCTVFYTLEGATESTSIDIDAGTNFSIRDNGGNDVCVGIYNLTIKNGGDFISFDNLDLNGVVEDYWCKGNVWNNVDSWCGEWSNGGGENDGARVDKALIAFNTVENCTANHEGFEFRAGEFTEIRIIGNVQTCGDNGIRVGFIANTDPIAEQDERRYVVIANNQLRNISSDSAGGATVACILAHAMEVIIIGNTCRDVTHATIEDDVECIYTKAQRTQVVHNTLSDCGSKQGAIIAKGMGAGSGGPPGPNANCTQGACGRWLIIEGNMVRNTDFTKDSYNGVWVQAGEALICNNFFIGMGNRAVKFQGGVAREETLICDNIIQDHAGPIVFEIEGNNHKRIVIRGNIVGQYIDAEVTTLDIVNITVAGAESMFWIAIEFNHFLVQDDAEGDTVVGVHADVAGTLGDIQIIGNRFEPDQDINIEFTGTGTINRPSIYLNEMQGTDPYFEAAGLTVNDCLNSLNRGWAGAEGDSC